MERNLADSLAVNARRYRVAIKLGTATTWDSTIARRKLDPLPPIARTFSTFEAVAAHLEKYHRIASQLASDRLHAIKHHNGLGGADNVLFDRTGNVYDPIHKEWLGSMTAGGGHEGGM